MAEEHNIDALVVGLKAATDEVKRHAETTQTEIKNLGKVTDETKAAADKALASMNDISARLTDVEQKMARRGQGERPVARTLGQEVTENEGVKALLASKRGKVSVETKAIISALTTDAAGSAGDLIVPQRQAGIVMPPQRRLTVRDLLTPGRTSSNAIQYVKETGFVNNAATVSETTGALKPQSDIKFDIMTTPVTTIAHWVLATKQILDDVPQLQSYIDGRLRYGLAYVEEMQLLMGSGTGTDLNGIYTQATAYSAPAGVSVANPTMIDQLRLALLQATLAELPATGMVLNPIQWAGIELTKDAAGGYIFADPQGVAQPRLWGLPVVATQAMTTDKFLVGAFQLGAQIFDREDANVEISTEDSDNFRKNLCTIRAEERLGLAVYRPEAFIKGDLGQVA
ncbi:phage major capsid protein [Roseomonas mucosa]|uniref:phage major capsid protein n=1 Tax=Roseomonas mucosa TaxID=207340 RepID=UPI00384C5E21